MLCKVKSIVYEGVCLLCDDVYKSDTSKQHKGRYIGQSYRSLYERCIEHETSYRRKESSSFMFKHWAVCHSDILDPPKFAFRVLRCHRDPMSRMVHEALTIKDCASMNSKSEFKTYKIARITVEKSNWEVRKELENDELTDKHIEVVMNDLRAKVDSSKNCTNNPLNPCRKRKMADNTSETISPILKRGKSDARQLGARPKVPNTVKGEGWLVLV